MQESSKAERFLRATKSELCSLSIRLQIVNHSTLAMTTDRYCHVSDDFMFAGVQQFSQATREMMGGMRCKKSEKNLI